MKTPLQLSTALALIVYCSNPVCAQNVDRRNAFFPDLDANGPNYDDFADIPKPGPPYPDPPNEEEELGPDSGDADFGDDLNAAIASLTQFFKEHPTSAVILLIAGGSFLISVFKES